MERSTLESPPSTLPAVLAPRRAVRGSIAWFLAWLVIACALAALVISARQAAIDGDYRAIITHETLTPFITAGFAVIGALVASRRTRHPIGWIFMGVGVLYALISLATAGTMAAPQASPLYAWAYWLDTWIWIPATLLPGSFVPLIFPDGRLPSPRWRFVAWSAALGTALAVLGVMFHPGPLVSLGLMDSNRFGIPALRPVLDFLLTLSEVFLAVGVIGSMAALLLRFRRSTGIEREQIKWLVYALGIYLSLGILTSLFAARRPDLSWGLDLSIVVTNLGMLGIAVAAAIAILRYRLYDIDLIINRTLVYSALTAGVFALYVLVVGGLGSLFRAGGNWLSSLIATGLAIILVQPLRDRLQQAVNRLMYGERDDPYAVLSGLSRRLEGALPPDATLPAVVETVAQALKLPYVAIALKQGDDFPIAASYGTAGEYPVQMPLIYRGETLGYLKLSPRSPSEPFTPAEQRLLRDIARHIGATAHTVLLTRDLRQLANDLQHSREELVKSREEERRRLRRDLHDELGPQLASLNVNLDVARNLVSRDPRAAETLLADLRSQGQSAIANIRRLVFDLRPPALDELGLIGAIQEFISQVVNQDALDIRLDCPKDMPPLPAAVEVAVYRITREALANFVRHSQGKNCRVSLSISDHHLQVEICDDGYGLPKEVRPGMGLSSMRERAAELGGQCTIETRPQGGTRILAQLPIG